MLSESYIYHFDTPHSDKTVSLGGDKLIPASLAQDIQTWANFHVRFVEE
jgi:hypothetical protein